MRLGRLAFILFAIYLVFIGGSAYYTLIFPVRIAHHILITVVLGLWLLIRVRRNGLPRTALDWPISAAVIVWIISVATSIDQRMAFENLWFPFIHVIFFYILANLFQRGRQRLIMETQFMLGAAVVMLSGLELASWYFGLGIIPGTQTGWIDVIGSGAWLPIVPIRLALAMNISTLLAGYVAPLVTITAAWALTARQRDFRRVLWVLAGALVIILILTFSRGGLLSILTAVGTLGVFRLAQMPRVTQRIPARALAGVTLFVGVVIVAGYVILSLTQARSTNSGDEGRLDMWRSAAVITQNNPVSGIGPGVFGRAFRSYRDPTIVQDKLASAHNAYLNTAAETGLLGVAVNIWMAMAFLRTWYRNWKQTNSQSRKLRLEAALGALIGLGVHSLVDVFTITPIVLIMLVLVTYCITPTEMMYEGLRPAETGSIYRRILAALALVAIVGYGIWLNQLDSAQTRYLSSFGNPQTALANAQAAIDIDPGLNLYRLQIAYVRGHDVLTNPNANIQDAIDAYQQAVQLEPTWDTGWINLAALELRQGDEQTALEYLDAARKINIRNAASLQWAILAEKHRAAPENEIVSTYADAIGVDGRLPLTAFWWETAARQAAVEQYLSSAPLDIQYRVLTAHDPERATKLVPASPGSATEWWVAGEYALQVKQDMATAANDFSQAIQGARKTGDYYVSRAWATYQSDPTSAKRDVNIAELLGTSAEYPNLVRAAMASTPEEASRLRANAIPGQPVLQEFAAVLYGRPALFDIFPEMRGE
ncbi:MAG: O-antigen ligase family protein [Chloroflexota bacterium]